MLLISHSLSWEHFPFVLRDLQLSEICGVAKLVIPWDEHQSLVSPGWRESRQGPWDIPVPPLPKVTQTQLSQNIPGFHNIQTLCWFPLVHLTHFWMWGCFVF